LTLKTGPDDIVIPFVNGGGDQTLAANYEVFFTALDKTNFPVDSCVLSNIASCGTPLATGGNVAIGSSPWAITAKRTIIAGYTSDVCIRCSIGSNTFDWKGKTNAGSGWKINQAPDCSLKISVKPNKASLPSLNIVVPYDASGTTQLISANGINDIFINTDKTNCPW